jgi:hypothetical protein
MAGLEVDEVFNSPLTKKGWRSHTAGEGDGGRGKGLQLRLELGNVVTGEGERGESGSWRLDG